MNEGRISIRSLLIFALPTIPVVLLLAPLGSVLPAFYAENTAATLTAIGTVLIVARLFDAFTDPLIGYLSDNTKSRFGPRKPWIAAGTALAMVSAVPLFTPPESVGAGYFMAWSACAYLAWTLIFIPYNAWASELSASYSERARIFTFRNMVGGVGGILFAAGPLIFSPFTGSTEMNAVALEVIAWLIVVLMPLCVGVTLIWGPERRHIEMKRGSFQGLFGAIKNNQLLWFFMATSVLAGLATGIQLSTFFFVLSYLELMDKFSYIAGAGMITGILSLPLWLRIVSRFGKHRPWAVSLLSQALVLPVVLTLEPGSGAFLTVMALSVFTSVMGSCVLVSASAMLSDVIDYDMLKTGVNRTANYFSVVGLIGKLNMAISGGLGFYIAAWFGFDPKKVNDADSALGLLFAYAGVPAVLGLMAGMLLWRYPLGRRKHGIIQKRLEQRATRSKSPRTSEADCGASHELSSELNSELNSQLNSAPGSGSA